MKYVKNLNIEYAHEAGKHLNKLYFGCDQCSQMVRDYEARLLGEENDEPSDESFDEAINIEEDNSIDDEGGEIY